jgi:hypothetical protein
MAVGAQAAGHDLLRMAQAARMAPGRGEQLGGAGVGMVVGDHPAGRIAVHAVGPGIRP